MVAATMTIAVMVVVLIMFVALGYSYSAEQMDTVEDFLAARKQTTVPLGLATFIAYAAGSGMLFSPPESGWLFGMPAIIGYGFALATPFLLFMSVAPKIQERMPSGHSVVEYARFRYGELMYGLVLIVALFYMFILMTANLTGIALALEAISGVDLWITLVLIGSAVMIYTVQGGLVASIFTDLIQTVILIPLLIATVAVAVFQLGGFSVLYTELQQGAPQNMSLSNPSGVRFGVYIIIALIGAEMLNQSLWQRAHSGRDKRTLQLSFIGAAIAVVPMTILAGMYGVMAKGLALDVNSPSAALPAVVTEVYGPTMELVFVVLALLVIASTLDNALSAIVSILSVDIVPRIDPNRTGDDLLRTARIITFFITVISIGIALTRPSVLFLLLRADLLAAATVVPVLLGLYTPKLGGKAAFAGAVLGILGGIPFFLRENYLFSFSTALIVSSVICVVLILVAPADFDYQELKDISSLDR